MPARLTVSKAEFAAFMDCPARFYLGRVGCLPALKAAERYEFQDQHMDQAMIEVLQSFYNGAVAREGLSSALLQLFQQGIAASIHPQQALWLAETYQAYYFDAQYRFLEAFIERYDLPQHQLAGKVLTVRRPQLDLADTVPIYADGVLHLIYRAGPKGTTRQTEWWQTDIMANYYLLTQNGYPVKEFRRYALRQRTVQVEGLPDFEQVATFEYQLDNLARKVLAQDCYPSLSNRCRTCRDIPYCQNFALGGIGSKP
jgi:hypothetical protein